MHQAWSSPPSSASVRSQILKHILTTSGMTIAHDFLHHVDIVPRPGGCHLPVLASATAVPVWAVYIPRSSRFVCLLSVWSSGWKRGVNSPGIRVTVVLVLLGGRR